MRIATRRGGTTTSGRRPVHDRLRGALRAIAGSALLALALVATTGSTPAVAAAQRAGLQPAAPIVGDPIAPGQFEWLTGLTSDGQHLYAADRGRIVKLEANPLRAVAAYDLSAQAPFLVRTPRSQAGAGATVMAASADYVFVADGDRIVRLSTALDGSGIASFGAGRFRGISGLAVSGDSLFVADSGNDRIVRLSTALDGSGWAAFGKSGRGDGQFGRLAGIAVAGGSVFAADAGNDRIVRLSTALDGSGWAAYARSGAGFYGAISVKGQVLYVRATDCAQEDRPGIARIPVSLSTSGVSCLTTPPTDFGISPASFETDAVVTEDGTYVGVDAYFTGSIGIRRLLPDSPEVAETYGQPAYGALGQLAAPAGAAADETYLYVCDLASTAPYASTRIVQLRRSDRTFVRQIDAPCSSSRIAAGAGYVFGADDTTVYRYRASDLAAAGHYGVAGRGRGGFGRIEALAAAAGAVYVVDGGLGRVARFGAASFDGTGWAVAVGIGRLARGSTWAAADGTGLYLVTSAAGGRTRILRTGAALGAGWRLRTLTAGGRAVSGAGGIAAADGRVYVVARVVASGAAPRIVALRASDLAALGEAGVRGSATDGLTNPTGIAAIGGHLYIADGLASTHTTGKRPGARVAVWTYASAG